MTIIHVGTFGGASAFPLEVARRTGMFATAGLDVRLSRSADSAALRAGLAARELDVVHLAPDNVIAWRDGSSGVVPLLVRVFVAGSNGPIALVARRATAMADLRGGHLGVDSIASGFVAILRRLLASAGIREDDVTLVPIGGTRARAVALADGTIDATMLTLPWSSLAVARGAQVVADHRAVAPGLLTSCGAAQDAWLARDGGGPARAYAVAVDAAMTWLRGPGSAALATPWLAEDLGADEATAEAVLAVMLDPSAGWPWTSDLRAGDMDIAWQVRAEVGQPPALAPDAYLWLPGAGTSDR